MRDENESEEKKWPTLGDSETLMRILRDTEVDNIRVHRGPMAMKPKSVEMDLKGDGVVGSVEVFDAMAAVLKEITRGALTLPGEER